MDFFQFLNVELLNESVWGAPVSVWLTAVLLWVGIGLALFLVHRFLRWRVAAFARTTTNQFDDVVSVLLETVSRFFLIALALYIAVALVQMPLRVITRAGHLVVLLLAFQVGRWGFKLIDLYVRRYKERKMEEDAASVTTMQAVGLLGKILLVAIVVLVMLDNFGVDVTALVTGLGIGGIAVALAVQNVLGDLFASLSIVLDKPFVVGDFVIVGEFMGTVEKIGMKTTRLRSLSGEQLVFSNSDLLGSRIRNYKRMYERRVVFGVGVVYQTPREQLPEVSKILRESVEAQDQVRFDRAHFKAFGAFSLDFEVVYYVLAPEFNLYMDIQQKINLEIVRRFETQGIEFAYPTQTLYLNGVDTMVGSGVAQDGDAAAS